MEEMEEKGKGMVQKMERLTAREKMEVFVTENVYGRVSEF